MTHTHKWDRLRVRAISKLANSRYRRSKNNWWRMQEIVLYFQIETQKYQLNLDTMPRCQCAIAFHSRYASDTMPFFRRADTPQSAAVAVWSMTNVRNSFVFSKRDTKISTHFGHDATLPTCWYSTACRSRCASDMMLRRQHATVRQSGCVRDSACCVPACLPLLRSCHRF